MKGQLVLSLEKQFEIRFSEIDMMNVVWHGAYPLYLEDAREAFGAKYGLSYHRYIDENVFVPIVEMNIQYKHPLTYGMKPIIKITYRPTNSAKVIFDYEIMDSITKKICVIATTTQVFMDRNYNLLWYSPDFYNDWKTQMGLI